MIILTLFSLSLIFFFLLNKTTFNSKSFKNLIITSINAALPIPLSESHHLKILKSKAPLFSLISLIIIYFTQNYILSFIILTASLTAIYIVKLRRQQLDMLEVLALDFPFFLNLLNGQLKTGLSLYQSIEKICLCLSFGPLKNMLEDFKQLSKNSPSISLILKNMRQSYPNQCMLKFCLMVEDSLKHGTPIAQSIETLAQDIEEEHYIYAEQQIQKIPVKLLAPLMLCIFPVTFIIIFVPVALSFV